MSLFNIKIREIWKTEMRKCHSNLRKYVENFCKGGHEFGPEIRSQYGINIEKLLKMF